MIFSAGNIVTLVIAIGLLLLYRFLDRNNRSLEKVRKYADKLKEDLGIFVEQRQVELKDYAIELDVRQKAAREVLNRAKEVEHAIDSRSDALDAMGKRIVEYDKVLDDLMGMTERAEENLARIREESEFADSVAAKLQDSQSKLDKVMTALPSIQADFDRRNAEGFSRSVAELRAKLDKSLTESEIAAKEAAKRSAAAVEEIARNDKARAQRAHEDLAAMEAAFEKAFERARKEAEKLEDAAFTKLRESITGRAQRLQEALEEKYLSLQTQAKDKIQETQGMLKAFRAESLSESKALADESASAVAAVQARLDAMRTVVETMEREVSSRSADSVKKAQAAIQSFESGLAADLAERGKRVSAQALAELEKQVAAGKEALAGEYGRLHGDLTRSLAELRADSDQKLRRLTEVETDIGKLEAALRQAMAEVQSRVMEDFSSFGTAMDARHEEEKARLTASMNSLQENLGALERGVSDLKASAYQSVSEKLKVFEDAFSEDLLKRGAESSRRLDQWKTELDKRLAALSKEADAEREAVERAYLDDVREQGSALSARLQEQMSKLDARLAAASDSLAERMRAAEESVASSQDSLKRDAAEARDSFRASSQAEFARLSQEIQDGIKKADRELAAWKEQAARSASDAEAKALAQRKAIAESLAILSSDAGALGATMAELKAEAAALADQAKTFQKADGLKAALERDIEELQAGISRAEAFRAELAEMEGQLQKARRQEEEMSQKIARFSAERRRIDGMEEDFRRLLSLSQTIDQRLESVTAQNDELAEAEERIRKLMDIAGEAESKYERLERKSSLAESTADGVDRNLRLLTDMDKVILRHNEELESLPDRLIDLKRSIETVTSNQERVEAAVQRLNGLDETLTTIEQRIKEMQKAREWLAGTETRLQELAKEAQEQVKIFGDIMKSETEAGRPREKGAPPVQTRDTVTKLARQGWTVEQISRATKLSRGEVELILELGPRR